VNRPTLTALVLAGVAVLGAAGTAAAQAPPRRPPASPYLSLTGDPLNAAGAYYGVVRPQLDLRNSVQRLQSQVNRVEAADAVGIAGPQELPPTGQRAGYMTHQRYFLNSGAAPATGPRSPTRR
jgi:hypothetical protein